jgi:DNA-binding transcriptional regulator YdaS (Cro superfamily)
MSRRMADACERVVAMLDAVPEADPSAHAMATLVALVPLLEQHAAQEANAPAVRAVYIGAATRIREVQAAELRAVDARGGDGTPRSSDAIDAHASVDDAADDDTDDEFDPIDDDDAGDHADDEDVDDDVDDDDLHEHLTDDEPPTPTPAPARGPRA